MFVNNISVNGTVLVTAFVRADESGVTFTGITEAGENFQAYFQFVNGVQVNFGVADAAAAPVKKERKARKPKAQPESTVAMPAAESAIVLPAVESVEVVDDETYLSLTKGRGRGRPSKDVSAKIAAYKAAHGIQ